MKKTYLLMSTLITGVAFGQFGQIENGGFEDWTNTTVYDYPTQWSNSNINEFYGIPTLVKSSDAQDGSYSIELRSVEAGPTPDTLFGYCYHGEENFNYGIPYNDPFDEVQIYYQSDLLAGDSAYLILQRFSGGVGQGLIILPIAQGTQGTWILGSVSIPTGTQDSLWIGFVLGNPFIGDLANPGSWVRLDNVKLLNSGSTASNVPDHSFEDWTAQAFETADNWYSSSDWLVGSGLENVIKTTDANTGSYAIELTTIEDLSDGDTIAGIISVGPIDFGNMTNPFGKVPYVAVPTTISGAYKYAPVSTDGAMLVVEFFALGTSIGIHFEPFTAQGSYTTFTSSLTISGTPDSMSLIAFSGDNPGSVLKLDDLSFSGGDVGVNEFESMNVNVYPNPAAESVFIKAEGEYTYAILDLAGNVLMNNSKTNGAIELDISHLSRGTYLIRIYNGQTSETLKLMIQ